MLNKYFLLATLFLSSSLGARSYDQFMVRDSELKAQLNSIFGKAKSPEGALRGSDAVTFLKDDSQLVAEHELLPGWIIKALPDKGSYKSSFLSDTLNVGRVPCAHQIRRVIDKYNLEGFVVPQKFLYKLPRCSGPLNDTNTVVIAQKLHLHDDKANRQRWRNLTVADEDALLLIIEKVGFMDMTIPNVVFTTDGDMAFIDTEPRWRIDSLEQIGVLRRMKRKILAMRGRQKLRHSLHEANDDF